MVWALFVTVASSWYLVGLTWVVDLVTYPSFSLVGDKEWPAYHRSHTAKITAAVAPAWILQAVGLAGWLLDPPAGTLPWAICCAILAVVAVVITVARAVPAHEALAVRYEQSLQQQLLRWHRIRSISWTLCALSSLAGLVVVVSR